MLTTKFFNNPKYSDCLLTVRLVGSIDPDADAGSSSSPTPKKRKCDTDLSSDPTAPRTYHISKAILATYSTYFENVFEARVVELEDKGVIVELEDIELLDAFDTFLQFVYKDASPQTFTDHQCLEILLMADRFSSDVGMKEICDFISIRVKSETLKFINNLWSLPFLFYKDGVPCHSNTHLTNLLELQGDELRRLFTDLICLFNERVIYYKVNFEAVYFFIRYHKFKLLDEIEVHHVVQNWLQANPSHTASQRQLLLDEVRYHLLDVKYLIKIIETDSYEFHDRAKVNESIVYHLQPKARLTYPLNKNMTVRPGVVKSMAVTTNIHPGLSISFSILGEDLVLDLVKDGTDYIITITPNHICRIVVEIARETLPSPSVGKWIIPVDRVVLDETIIKVNLTFSI